MGESVEIRKLDYLYNLPDVKKLEREYHGGLFDQGHVIDLQLKLQDIKLILSKNISELNPEEKKVYDKFKKDELIVARLLSALESALFNVPEPTSNEKLRAVPIIRRKPLSVNVVPLGEGMYSIGNPNALVSMHVLSAFNAKEDSAKSAILAYGKALALANSPYASKSAKEAAAEKLASYLEKMNPAQLSPIQEIVDKLKKGDISALESLRASGTAITTQMEEALANSKIIFYDRHAITDLSGEAIIVWELPSSRAFKEFMAGVKDQGLAVVDIYLALKASGLAVGATRFKPTASGNVTTERTTERGFLGSATPGFSLGTGLFGIPTLIDISAEFGYIQYGEGEAAQKNFYVGVQTISFSFPGKESERLPIRISSMGLSHSGTAAKEDYLAYMTLSTPARRSATVDMEIHVSPYVSNYFGLLYSGAKPEVAMKIFPTKRKTNFGLELSAGADLWIGDEHGLSADPGVGAGLVWGPFSVKALASLVGKYEPEGEKRPTLTFGLEGRF